MACQLKRNIYGGLLNPLQFSCDSCQNQFGESFSNLWTWWHLNDIHCHFLSVCVFLCYSSSPVDLMNQHEKFQCIQTLADKECKLSTFQVKLLALNVNCVSLKHICILIMCKLSSSTLPGTKEVGLDQKCWAGWEIGSWILGASHSRRPWVRNSRSQLVNIMMKSMTLYLIGKLAVDCLSIDRGENKSLPLRPQ